MLLTKELMVAITARNVNHYRDKGYAIPIKYNEKTHTEITDFGKTILVKVEDMPDTSKNKVQCKCDNCQQIQELTYCDWKRRGYSQYGDLCKVCAVKIKLPQVMQDKYGVSNAASLSSAIEKKKQTNLQQYGTEWAIASDTVKDKILETMLQKYGVDNAMKNTQVQQKAKYTNQERYGGDSPMCDDGVKAKSQQTCMDKYGVVNPAQNKEIQAKARTTLYKNGNVPSSRVEKALCQRLITMFGVSNCFPNYPVGNLSLDCLVYVNGQPIDIEYDGCYWHKDRQQHDAARNAVLMDNGYRIIRIKANNKDILPSIEQIQNAVDYLVKDNHHLTFIDMND